jgi:ribosomal protein S18 acetylase RimI-like enzyme
MTGDDSPPEEAVGPFDPPPTAFEDRDGRSITVRRYDSDRDQASLLAMYEAFDPADRAQGIPPSTEERIAEWLETITGPGTVNVVATHETAVVGHATLVPDDRPQSAELAIFVLQAYQHAGIGTRLLETLLGAGAVDGFEQVWLTVERWNEPAIRLYEHVGFHAIDTESFEHRMAIRLADQTESTG